MVKSMFLFEGDRLLVTLRLVGFGIALAAIVLLIVGFIIL